MIAEINNITNRQLEIIEAAGKILSTEGIMGLTIKNLAKEMEFSESAIYRHFTSKEEIIVTMLDYMSNNMAERFEKAILENMSPIAKFETLFKSQFSFFKKHPYFAVAVFTEGLMEKSKKINESVAKIMQVKMKYLMPIISVGQQKNDFTNNINTDELIHIVMGTIRLQMYKWRMANFKFDIVRNGDNMIEALLTLIKEK